MKHYLGTLLLVSLFLLSCSGSKKSKVDPNQINFSHSKSLSPLLERAEKENKLLFVDIMTDWCLPCKMMDEDVFSDPSVVSFMNANFINYKVDAEKENGPLLALVYEVSAYPTLVFVDEKGKVIVKNVGAVSQSQLLNLAREALAANTNL